MNIAVLNLTNGGMSGGYRKYLLNFIPRLAANDHVKSILCVSPEALRVETWFRPMPNVEFAGCPSSRFFGCRINKNLRQKIERFAPDIIFIPVARVSNFADVPVVTMVQNVYPFLSQGVPGLSLGETIRLRAQYVEAKKAFQKSEQIIVTSNYVKGLLIDQLGIPDERISLVYFGKNPVILDAHQPDCISFERGEAFIFTAGSLEPYRGLEDLIKAAGHLKNDFPDLKVVVAGQARPATLSYYRKLLRLCELYDLGSRIFWAGQLSPEELAWCYKNCVAFVMTSRMESFGMIGLESLSYGSYCVSAENLCLREIFGPAAVYYSPGDDQGLAALLKKAVHLSQAERDVRSGMATERASQFSWDMNADKTVEVFREVLQRSQR